MIKNVLIFIMIKKVMRRIKKMAEYDKKLVELKEKS